MKSFFIFAVLLALGSCSLPPKPPTADESKRHPVNSVAEVGWQSCKGELQSSRTQVAEKTSYAEGLRSRLSTLFAARSAPPSATDDARNTSLTILFPFGATSVQLRPSESDALIAQARSAPLIVLSGRTDGTSDSATESRIARERAEFVRDVLLRSGIPAARIRTTWQPVGDHAADNASSAGRTLNRRVEVEIYRTAPRSERLGPVDAA